LDLETTKKWVSFPTSYTQHFTCFNTMFTQFKANFGAETLFFQVCNFLALRKFEQHNLTRYYSTATCILSLNPNTESSSRLNHT
jgi:hypothetical protein